MAGGEITIVDAGGEGVLGEIDNTGVKWSDGRGTLVGEGARQLRRLLGKGYGRRTFHMMLASTTLEHCRVISPHLVFTYREARLFDDDQPSTYPEMFVDEDTNPE